MFYATRAIAIVVGLFALGASAFGQEQDPRGVQFFEKNIRPVLIQNCYKCHSADSQSLKAGLLLDSRAGIQKGGETGPAVVPGSVADSLLISALRYEDLEMPPKGKLPDDVIANFVRWVEMGAPDPRGGEVAATIKKEIDWTKAREFWSFKPPTIAEPPRVKNMSWARTDIDRFVLSQIEAKQLQPVRDAEPRALARRIYFDLFGLPPTPAQIDAFEKEAIRNPNSAIRDLIDALLNSERFGERWGRHWLDVARYAESNGNADNTPFPHAWRYRDYVIDSVNQDKPYDQFITEQIAGDLLSSNDPAKRNEQLIATGFLAIGSKPRSQNNPDYQMDVVAEQIEVMTSTMLGLTVMCARCHDHKFDPIPTSEYYSLAGIFTSTRALYNTRAQKGKGQDVSGLIALASNDAKSAEAHQQHEQQLRELTSRKNEVESQLGKSDPKDSNPKLAAQIKKLRQQLEQLTQAAKKDPKEFQPQIDKVKNKLSKLGEATPSVDNSDGKSKEEIAALKIELNEITGRLAELQKNAPGPAGLAMGASEGNPADCQICIAGESQKRGESVPRGFITVATIGDAPQINPKQSGRLELAQWIADPKNPLTSRVMVNRIWQHLFGRGLVPSLDNFGALGESPTHPQLLDYLAVRFVEEDWSVKKMIREIMLTRTYQLSSDHDAKNHNADPDNILLWRVNPRRLDAESFRDAILAVSGQLTLDRPTNGPVDQTYNKRETPRGRAEGNYRSVYLPIIRNGVPEALGLFDFADPSIVVGQREVTTVPAQSLYLMNSPFIVQQSLAMAKRVVNENQLDNVGRVEFAYELSLGRKPSDEQRERAVNYVNEMTQALDSRESKSASGLVNAWATFCQTLLASAEFRYLD